MKDENVDDIALEAIAADNKETKGHPIINLPALAKEILEDASQWKNKKGVWDRAALRVEKGLKKEQIEDLLYIIEKNQGVRKKLNI